MKIEPGKEYKTRDGRKATDIERSALQQGRAFVFQGVVGAYLHTWTKDGHWSDCGQHDLDLVAEWTEPSDELATLRAENARLLAQNEALDSELLSLENESCYADDEIKAYCKEIDALRNELDSALTENARLREALDVARTVSTRDARAAAQQALMDVAFELKQKKIISLEPKVSAAIIKSGQDDSERFLFRCRVEVKERAALQGENK
jgi:predicted nuclease with TOPRIM domain